MRPRASARLRSLTLHDHAQEADTIPVTRSPSEARRGLVAGPADKLGGYLKECRPRARGQKRQRADDLGLIAGSKNKLVADSQAGRECQ
jgi:hypothetical protein